MAPHPRLSLHSAHATRRISWALVLSLLPMLTFLGHWTVELPLPGTNLYIHLPPPAPGDSHEHGDQDIDHESHCHGDSASCSDAPAAPGVAVAMPGDALALRGDGGRLEWLAGRHWEPSGSHTVAPDPAPPRPLL